MAEHFLTKSRVTQSALVTTAEGPVLERHGAMLAILDREAGSEAAALFAQPILGRVSDTGERSISWYTDRAGEPKRLSDLDGAARQDIEERLAARLQDVGRLLQSSDLAPSVGAMLTIPDSAKIWAVGGHPVISDWAILPEGAEASDDLRNQAYAKTLGRYLPLANATASFSGAAATAQTPPVPEEPVSAPAARVAKPATAAAAPAMAATAAQAGGTVPPNPPASGEPPQGEDPKPRSTLWAIWPAVVLIVLLGLLIWWLLLPNTRIFPPEPAPIQTALDDRAADIAREANRALRERAEALEDALNTAVCTDNGELMLPDGRTPEGLLPPAPSENGTEVDPSAPREGNATPLVPPSPDRVTVPPAEGQPASDAATLLDTIEARTVLIIAQGAEGAGIGTGFFIAPDLVATNHHVIADALPGGEVFVTNASFGTVHPAQILAAEGPFEQVGADFAVLKVEGATAPFFPIVDPTQELRLQGVIAAGFPMDIMQSDTRFQRLMDGDASAVPSMIVTDGVVSAVQEVSQGIDLVTHSAPISKGNSGGPLVDMCGRVVGMNTFVREEAFRNLNLAQATGNLIDFLARHGVTPQVVNAPCVPQVGPAPSAPAASAEGAAQ